MGDTLMMETAKALKQFASGFGCPAYTNSSVPDDVPLPYIVYPLTEPEWDQKCSFYLLLWDRATGYANLLQRADQIVAEIGSRGAHIPIDGGYVHIWPETPLIQEQFDKENNAKGIYINLSLSAYHLPGV